MTQAERGIEDRLLVIETKLNYLATKAELAEQIAKLRDDMRVWYFSGWATLLLAVIVSHFVK